MDETKVGSNGAKAGDTMRDFRSPLLILASMFSVMAAVAAIPGVAILFDSTLTERLIALMGVDFIDQSAQLSWLFVRALINMLGLLVPALIAVGLLLLVRAAYISKNRCTGVSFFMKGARATQVIMYIVGAALALLFVFRAIRYIVINGAQTGGILFIFAMLLPECVFAAIVAIIMFLAIRGIRSVIHTLDTIQLNILTGASESYGLGAGAILFVGMMGVAAVVLSVLNAERHAAIISFALAAVADFMLAAWLWWYRRKIGQRALETFRRRNNAN